MALNLVEYKTGYFPVQIFYTTLAFLLFSMFHQTRFPCWSFRACPLPRYTQDNMSRESDSVLPLVRHSRRREGGPTCAAAPPMSTIRVNLGQPRASTWVQRSSNQNEIERCVRVLRRKRPLHVHLPPRRGVIRLHPRGGLPPRPFHLAK